jgi:arylsulfatase A-like enzyme
MPPNIVLFVADDIPRNMLGAYGARSDLSPNLDALAREGVVFERAFTTAPLCTPSRFALLTGRYASNASSIVSHRPWNMVGFNTFLTGAEPTLAARLRRAGYATGFCGKYHLGFPLSKGPQSAKARGRAKFGGGGRGLSYEDMVESVRTYGGFEEVVSLWGGNKQTAQSPHNPEWMAAQAVGFVRRAAGAQPRGGAAAGASSSATRPSRRPFFLYFAGTVPHTPFSLPASFEVNVTRTPAGAVPYEPSWEAQRQRLLARLRPLGLICKDYRECHRLHYAGANGAKDAHNDAYHRPLALSDKWLDGTWLYSEPNFEQGRLARLFAVGLAWLDDSIGTVIKSLHEYGLRQSTVLIFTALAHASAHHDAPPLPHRYGLRQSTVLIFTADHGASFLGKGHVYEAGVRVPLIVSWPGGAAGAASAGAVAAPRRSTANVALIDLAPTLLMAAGAEVQAEAASLHGQSFLSLVAPHAAEAATARATRAAADARTGAAGAGAVMGAVMGATGAGAVLGATDMDTWHSRPIFVEIGYGRAVIRGVWKLLVINDPIDRCRAASDGTCRNLHAESIDRYQCNFTANGHLGNRLVCNMTYDAVARHAGFCDRRQLYNLEADPLEQRNVVAEHPNLYGELLALIVAHVRHVEAGNPAVANRTPNQCSLPARK